MYLYRKTKKCKDLKKIGIWGKGHWPESVYHSELTKKCVKHHAQALADAAVQQAQIQAVKVTTAKEESMAKSALATKAAGDASLAVKIAAAATAAAAKIPAKAVVVPQANTLTSKNSARATITGLKPGQKVKVTVNVKGK